MDRLAKLNSKGHPWVLSLAHGEKKLRKTSTAGIVHVQQQLSLEHSYITFGGFLWKIIHTHARPGEALGRIATNGLMDVEANRQCSITTLRKLMAKKTKKNAVNARETWKFNWII